MNEDQMTSPVIPTYPGDMAALSKLSAENRTEFDAGSLWTVTGAEAWLPYFEDGHSAAEAMDEDQSYD
jgi:hypothetical protein